MIEKILFDFLNEKGYKAYLERQPRMPKEFVLIDKTGGGFSSHIKTATIAIQAYSDTKYKASLLSESINEVMIYDLPELDEICRVELNSGSYDYTDTTTKEYRYQSVFDITYY